MTRSPTRSPAATPSVANRPGCSNSTRRRRRLSGTPRSARMSPSRNGDTSAIGEPSVSRWYVGSRSASTAAPDRDPTRSCRARLPPRQAVREDPPVEQRRNPGPPLVGQRHGQSASSSRMSVSMSSGSGPRSMPSATSTSNRSSSVIGPRAERIRLPNPRRHHRSSNSAGASSASSGEGVPRRGWSAQPRSSFIGTTTPAHGAKQLNSL